MSQVTKSDRKVKRTCEVWNAGGGRWVMTLTFWHPRRAAEDLHYHLTAIPSDWGRAFEVRKLAADGGEVYHVNLSDAAETCDCLGHEHHGHCKHVSALLALQSRGKLDAVQAAARVEGGAA